jgi:hypothetical protein
MFQKNIVECDECKEFQFEHCAKWRFCERVQSRRKARFSPEGHNALMLHFYLNVKPYFLLRVTKRIRFSQWLFPKCFYFTFRATLGPRDMEWWAICITHVCMCICRYVYACVHVCKHVVGLCLLKFIRLPTWPLCLDLTLLVKIWMSIRDSNFKRLLGKEPDGYYK